MKKSILSLVAAGAMTVAGGAMAQDILSVLPYILGGGNVFGTNTWPQTTPGIPAVVASGGYGQQQGVYVDQWGRRVITDSYGRQIVLEQNGTYQDQYGRRVFVDQAGRHVVLDHNSSFTDQYGRRVFLDQYGRTTYSDPNAYSYGTNNVYGNYGSNVYGSNYGYGTGYGTGGYPVTARDRDGDGVRNRDDRYPDDPRYR